MEPRIFLVFELGECKVELPEFFENDIVVLDLVAMLRTRVVFARLRQFELGFYFASLVGAVYLRAYVLVLCGKVL